MGELLLGERLEQPDLGGARDDGDGVEQPTTAGAQPVRSGEHGVAHGRRNVATLAREHLGDVEGVPAGGLVEAT